MAKILITGATGFLGSEIVRQAVAAGHQVHALKRITSNIKPLAGIAINWQVGDVTDPQSLDSAMAGMDYCIHTAGDTSYFLKDRRRLEKVNIQGVINVVAAAKKAGIKRLIHTSSVAALGFDRRGHEVNESIEWNWPTGLPYMETKRDGERIALQAAKNGLEVIVLNPATILGPGKMNASEEQMVREIREGKVPAVPPGGMTICDVADVARAHLNALERGRSGQRYILGGTSLTHEQLFRAFARAFHAKVPTRKAPGWLLGLAGGTVLLAEKAKIPVSTPSAMIRLARYGIYHSSAKAISELGYQPRPLEDLIARVVRDKIPN